jgi:transposase
MSGKRYPEEFKIQAVKQITDQGYSIPEVAKRLGLTPKSLYDWKAKYADQSGQYQKDKAVEAENKALKAELKRVTMERDILKEAAAFFAVESKKSTRS